MANKILKLGTDPFPPYQYYLEDGSIAGLDYDYVKKVFDQMGYGIDVTIKDWHEIQAVLDVKGYDAAFQVSKTPERELRYIFSEPFRYAVTELVTSRDDMKLDSLQQVIDQGLVIGVMAGYTNGDEIDALPDVCKKSYITTESLVEALSKGEVELGVVDKGVKEFHMKSMGIDNLYTLDKFTFDRSLHVIFFDPVLCEEFNRAMAVLRQEDAT